MMVTIIIVVATAPVKIIKISIIADKNSVNAYYPSVLNVLFSRLSKNMIKLCKRIVSPVVTSVSKSPEPLLYSLCPSVGTHETTREM
jgi:hypothetical protein